MSRWGDCVKGSAEGPEVSMVPDDGQSIHVAGATDISAADSVAEITRVGAVIGAGKMNPHCEQRTIFPGGGRPATCKAVRQRGQ